MIPRDITPTFLELLNQYPVVTLTGPRQSGKTTLVKSTCPHMPYYNLEEPDTRQRILSDPRTFFTQNPDGAILDEIQQAPELMSYIQSIVDEQDRTGLFILTGSNQLLLNQPITQSLAGRTALLELLPLSLHELTQASINLDLNESLIKGFYPIVYKRQTNPRITYANYIKTYLERDVRQLINVRDLHSFQTFIQLTAGRVGGILNIESIANDIGMSHNTIKHWVSILEASYLLHRLQPYYENLGKRLIKSPKIYFTDVGIISYLLGIESTQQIARDPLRGGIFENLVLLELMKSRLNAGLEPWLYYYRDSNQNEIDFIIKRAHQLIPIEVKSTATYNSALVKNLTFFKKLVGERMPTGFVVYAGKTLQIKDFHLINYKHTAKIYEILNELE